MRVKGRWHVTSKLLVLIGATVIASSQLIGTSARAADPIKVGWVGPLSPPGGYAEGALMKQAAEVAADELNAKGGVLGRPIKVIYAAGHRTGRLHDTLRQAVQRRIEGSRQRQARRRVGQRDGFTAHASGFGDIVQDAHQQRLAGHFEAHMEEMDEALLTVRPLDFEVAAARA